MSASCLDEKGRFKSCPYRVYTDEHIFAQVMKEWWQMEMKILNELAGMLEDINPNEIVSHILDGTLLPWLASWKMKSQMLVAFLLENEKARLSEKD